MNARERLTDKIRSQSTEMLVTIAESLNLKTDTDSMLVANMVANELELRLTENDFIDLMRKLESELMAA